MLYARHSCPDEWFLAHDVRHCPLAFKLWDRQELQDEGAWTAKFDFTVVLLPRHCTFGTIDALILPHAQPRASPYPPSRSAIATPLLVSLARPTPVPARLAFGPVPGDSLFPLASRTLSRISACLSFCRANASRTFFFIVLTFLRPWSRTTLLLSPIFSHNL